MNHPTTAVTNTVLACILFVGLAGYAVWLQTPLPGGPDDIAGGVA